MVSQNLNPQYHLPLMENSSGYLKPSDQVSINISNFHYVKISLLCSGIILLSATLTMVCYCTYRRWCIFKRSFRHGSNNPTPTTTTIAAVSSHGLDQSILKALPTFVYSSRTHHQVLECAVCLLEFQEGERGRVLPKCNHIFHIHCIDMWFHSHSNCPLCRAWVQFAETVLPVVEPSGSSSQPELRQKMEGEKRSFGGSSSSSASLSLVECKRMSLDLAGIVVEVPKSTKDVESPLDLCPLEHGGSSDIE